MDMDPLSPGVSSTISDSSSRPSSTFKIKSENCGGSVVGVKHPVQVARRNERERNRVRQVNMGFVTLRNHVPQSNSKSKKLSKVDTLRSAASYIQYLKQLLDTDHLTTNYNGHSMPNLLAQTLQSYASHDHQSSTLAHFGGSTVVPDHVKPHHTTSNYYNSNFTPQTYAPTLFDGNNYSNHHYKSSPSTTVCNSSPQNNFVSDNGYDYVLSPPEIKQYHASDFAVMQTYH